MLQTKNTQKSSVNIGKGRPKTSDHVHAANIPSKNPDKTAISLTTESPNENPYIDTKSPFPNKRKFPKILQKKRWNERGVYYLRLGIYLSTPALGACGGCSLVVRIPRCGRGDLGSNPSSHSFITPFYFLAFHKKLITLNPKNFGTLIRHTLNTLL